MERERHQHRNMRQARHLEKAGLAVIRQPAMPYRRRQIQRLRRQRVDQVVANSGKALLLHRQLRHILLFSQVWLRGSSSRRSSGPLQTAWPLHGHALLPLLLLRR